MTGALSLLYMFQIGIVRSVLHGLQYLHSKNIVHRGKIELPKHTGGSA